MEDAERFRLGYTGARLITDRAAVWADLDAILARHPVLLLRHGAAKKGGDEFADEWALARIAGGADIVIDRRPAPWRMGKIAGPMRNGFMVGLGMDGMLAHLRPGSTGSGGCADFAEWAGVPVLRSRVA